MRPLANLREGSLFMSVSPLKACPFNVGIVCISTAMVVVVVKDGEDDTTDKVCVGG